MDELTRSLGRAWCEAFAVAEVSDGTYSVASPFLLPDGDGFAVLLERTENGWRLTDGGITASRAFGSLDVTAAREKRFRAAADALGVALVDWELSLDVPSALDVRDLAHFMRAVMTAASAPGLESVPEEREEYYSKQLSDLIRARVSAPVTTEVFVREDARQLYRVDLRIERPQRAPVMIFTVGNEVKAERTVGAVLRFREWNVRGDRFVAVKPTVPGRSVYRLQDVLGDERVALLDTRDRFAIDNRLRELQIPLL